MPDSNYLEFPYYQLGKDTFRPIIKFKVKNFSPPHRQFKIGGLIDSGADFCLFPGWIAVHLGHGLKKGTEINVEGISKIPLICYAHKNYIIIENKTESFKYSTMIYFSEDYNGTCLLGHAGLFTHFKVEFHYDKKTIRLYPYLHRFPQK